MVKPLTHEDEAQVEDKGPEAEAKSNDELGLNINGNCLYIQ